MIKAVIFDMDGLLIDSEPLWILVFKQIFKDKFNVTLTDDDMLEVRGVGMQEAIRRLFQKFNIKSVFDKSLEDAINDKMKIKIANEGKLMPGVLSTIQTCKDAGLPIAIASSSAPEIIDAVVETLKLRVHFDHLYSARHEPYGKPHPGVFLKVAEHFSVDSRDCLVFEDAPAGVLAAKAANMHCIAVPDPTHQDHPFTKTADIIIGSLEEFDVKMLDSL